MFLLLFRKPQNGDYVNCSQFTWCAFTLTFMKQSYLKAIVFLFHIISWLKVKQCYVADQTHWFFNRNIISVIINWLLNNNLTILLLEQFSFEWNVIGLISTTLHDWLKKKKKKLVPVFHPIRSETKTNRDAFAQVFPGFTSVTCNFFQLWLVHCIFSVPFVISCSDYFACVFRTLAWKQL